MDIQPVQSISNFYENIGNSYNKRKNVSNTKNTEANKIRKIKNEEEAELILEDVKLQIKNYYSNLSFLDPQFLLTFINIYV